MEYIRHDGQVFDYTRNSDMKNTMEGEIMMNQENRNGIENIYFDMDGVLADFDNGVRKLCHILAPDGP